MGPFGPFPFSQRESFDGCLPEAWSSPAGQDKPEYILRSSGLFFEDGTPPLYLILSRCFPMRRSPLSLGCFDKRYLPRFFFGGGSFCPLQSFTINWIFDPPKRLVFPFHQRKDGLRTGQTRILSLPRSIFNRKFSKPRPPPPPSRRKIPTSPPQS